MKLLALAVLAASMLTAAEEAKPAPPPATKVHKISKKQQLELLGVIAEAMMLTQQAESSQPFIAAKAAVQRQNETIDKVRLAIDCKMCGFNVLNGKITVLEPPPTPPAPAK